MLEWGENKINRTSPVSLEVEIITLIFTYHYPNISHSYQKMPLMFLFFFKCAWFYFNIWKKNNIVLKYIIHPGPMRGEFSRYIGPRPDSQEGAIYFLLRIFNFWGYLQQFLVYLEKIIMSPGPQSRLVPHCKISLGGPVYTIFHNV